MRERQREPSHDRGPRVTSRLMATRRECLVGVPLLCALLIGAVPSTAAAQHAAFRIKGRVKTDAGEPVANAEVRVEAFYGYFAAAFGGGQRTFSGKTNDKGDWNVGGLQPGVWLFEVFAPGFLPETVILPIRILTTVSMGSSGMSLTWDLILKPLRAADDELGAFLVESTTAVRDGHAD